MENENFIRTLSYYQIEELKTLFMITKIQHIGREDKTGDILVEYHQMWVDGGKMEIKRIPFNPPPEKVGSLQDSMIDFIRNLPTKINDDEIKLK
jgi:hypothetical protein